MSDQQQAETPQQAGEFLGHMPAPWQLGVDLISDANGWKVCDTSARTLRPYTDTELLATRRLIEAAPRLLRERDEARAELAGIESHITASKYGFFPLHGSTVSLAVKSVCDERDNLRDEFAKVTEQRDELVKALRRLVASFDAPEWRGADHPDSITESRALLARLKMQGGAQ